MALKPSDHPRATRQKRGHKRGSNLRAEPQGPLGHLIQNAVDRKHLSYPRAAKFLNVAIKQDAGQAASITHSSLRNWISRWVIPQPDTQRALMAVLGIPERTLTKAIKAQRVAREALTLNLSERRRGLVLTDLALVALQRYEIEQACAHGAAAMEIARLSASGVIKRRLVDLRQRLTPLAHVPSVKQYIDEMASL